MRLGLLEAEDTIKTSDYSSLAVLLPKWLQDRSRITAPPFEWNRVQLTPGAQGVAAKTRYKSSRDMYTNYLIAYRVGLETVDTIEGF